MRLRGPREEVADAFFDSIETPSRWNAMNAFPPHSLSLFDEIPLARSCEDAGVPPIHCICSMFRTHDSWNEKQVRVLESVFMCVCTCAYGHVCVSVCLCVYL
jgi:hypothetical protein